MCHHHWPGDGIDLMRTDASKGELLVRLSDDDCHYILTATEILRCLNPLDRKYQSLPPIVFNDDDTESFSKCHSGMDGRERKAHEHRFPDLFRCESDTIYNVPYIEIAVTFCSCHVMVPVEIIYRLFARAGSWIDGPNAEIKQWELKEWYQSAEEYEYGWREMIHHERNQIKN